MIDGSDDVRDAREMMTICGRVQQASFVCGCWLIACSLRPAGTSTFSALAAGCSQAAAVLAQPVAHRLSEEQQVEKRRAWPAAGDRVSSRQQLALGCSQVLDAY